MKINFKNLAHISSGVFEKSNFSIIVGDNGSGKTLLLETVSFIEEYFNRNQFKLISEILTNLHQRIHLDMNFDMFFSDLNDSLLNDKDTTLELNQIGKTTGIYLKCDYAETVNLEINRIIHSKKPDIIKGVNERIFKGTCNDFDFEFYDLPSFDDKLKEFRTSFYLVENRIFIQLNRTFISIGLEKYKVGNLSGIDVSEELLSKAGIGFLNLEKFKIDLQNELKKAIIEDLLSNYFEFRETLYLPSERSTYMYEGYRKVLNNFSGVPLMRYSEELFVKEYLSAVNFNKEYKLQVKFSGELIRLFGGEPIIDEDGEIGSIVIGDLNLDKVLFSTKLNRAIPYILFEQPLTKFTWAVVEEPEAHMSLKTMNYLIDYLININKGTKLTITTHSDVFFGKLVNALVKNNVNGISVFEMIQNGEKTSVKKIEKNEYGYKINLFNNELEDLFKETLELQDGEQ